MTRMFEIDIAIAEIRFNSSIFFRGGPSFSRLVRSKPWSLLARTWSGRPTTGSLGCQVQARLAKSCFLDLRTPKCRGSTPVTPSRRKFRRRLVGFSKGGRRGNKKAPSWKMRWSFRIDMTCVSKPSIPTPLLLPNRPKFISQLLSLP